MKEFLITLVGISLLYSVIGMLIPEGNLSGVVRFAGVLCIVLVVMSPLSPLLSEIKEGGDWLGNILENPEKADRFYAGK